MSELLVGVWNYVIGSVWVLSTYKGNPRYELCHLTLLRSWCERILLCSCWEKSTAVINPIRQKRMCARANLTDETFLQNSDCNWSFNVWFDPNLVFREATNDKFELFLGCALSALCSFHHPPMRAVGIIWAQPLLRRAQQRHVNGHDLVVRRTLLQKGSDEVMTQKVKEVFKENQLRNGVGDVVPQRQMNQAELFYCLDFITPFWSDVQRDGRCSPKVSVNKWKCLPFQSLKFQVAANSLCFNTNLYQKGMKTIQQKSFASFAAPLQAFFTFPCKIPPCLLNFLSKKCL